MLTSGRKAIYALAFLMLISCSESDSSAPAGSIDDDFIRGADLSFLPMLEQEGTIFFNDASGEMDALSIFKEQGLNAVRIRLWYRPEDEHSSFNEVKLFAERVHSEGLLVWLTVHYSDSWADPQKQVTPADWQGITFYALTDSVYDYTSRIVKDIKPDIIQIGNEINPGLLFPYGEIATQEDQFLEILTVASKAVRDHDPEAGIMIQFAGYEGAMEFFDRLSGLDYNQIGISYYPWWHGKDMDRMGEVLEDLRIQYGKEVLIAETAYPFTLYWNDQTHNIIGLEDQLILPDFPASFQGQKEFLLKLREISTVAGCIGICYWAPEWVAFDGQQSQDGSPWENMALFDFSNKLLPGAKVFGIQ